MAHDRARRASGPFRAEHLTPGSPFELSDGHPIECMPAGGRHSRANLIGGLALETDPDADCAGVDTGFSLDPKNLRAPDIAVGNVPDESGWAKGAPPLAVEYADVGQHEPKLRDKIADLLANGTRHVWVVRMQGLRRVEVHEPNKQPRVVRPGQQLRAPGILKNPVPVEALYDPQAAHEAALRNLLQRQGYGSLEDVRDEGREEGREEGRAEGERAVVLRLLRRRLGSLSPQAEGEIRALSLPRLEALSEALFDFTALSDLEVWLRAPSPRP